MKGHEASRKALVYASLPPATPPLGPQPRALKALTLLDSPIQTCVLLAGES